ncbi:urea carboxylase [Synechococcus sp. PCC 7502]|uniref:urea carboxylase n=1 Tax=Synechococcus sp. PCC 7502 TaxID=1173263 RepID=UPI00029FD143|nr:urea carboxylase [Synechococcus sp. PCC 7502]AFY72856.1 urea carboxylase [Synechococcus sp. PCC 7502]
MFSKILIANRGEIACRIIRTCDRLGISTVAVYSEADTYSLHVSMARESVAIGGALASESYLRWERILEAAKQTGAEAIHPGYGFLSENAEFAEACAREGIIFIAPTPEQMRSFGLKHTARELAEQNQVPLLPGTGLLGSVEEALTAAEQIGYPVMLKSSAGGGGIGLQLCRSQEQLPQLYATVQRLSQNNFKQSAIYLERFVETARHIEVQIFGDGEGRVLALGDRDCSVQRRNQKVIEETPAPEITHEQRQELYEAALRLGRSVNYQSAGTVEFVFDCDRQEFYFLEVNTRLQVEHGVTETVTGVDLVEWMIRLAAGDSSFFDTYQHSPQGHSIQVRIYAEDPTKNFQPSSGILTDVRFPEEIFNEGKEIRCDRWIERGTEVTPYYDPLLAKLIVYGETRTEAITQMQSALAHSQIAGIETNLDYLRQILADPRFASGNLNTRFLNSFAYLPQTIDVLAAGTFTTVQDYPGRVGYWNIGVPPSGAMDTLALRYGNRLVGNIESAAGLEFTINGATLRFNTDTIICLTGARMEAEIDGNSIPFWQAISVSRGSILKIKGIIGNGLRAYLTVRNGIDVPDYLGSKSTFTLGKFGGHCGRILRVGDVLKLNSINNPDQAIAPSSLSSNLIPVYPEHWEIGVLYGPHGAPDFFTPEDIEMFFSTDWEVHYNSARTGIRLIGPKPQWARKDGGEAGLHPSNIHDNAYAIGAIDFTGDMPIILAVDGPSLGGFVCPATIALGEIWKIGQLKPGNTVRFIRITHEQALQLKSQQDQEITTLQAVKTKSIPLSSPFLNLNSLNTEAVLHKIDGSNDQIAVKYRRSGDDNILIEYGEMVLDLNLRFRVHALMSWLEAHPLAGILDLTPGIRSLQIHYDHRLLSLERLLETLINAESELPAIADMEVPTRIVYLPLSWDDPSTQLAIEKYVRSVNPKAPWCPSNIEFIRRINGLESIEAVQEIIFNASYLVLGLGDVYLGAPVATPIDPRHRLVTTKYNPARTWTPENAVGIGGAYMCVYGMEGPGGYQFFGRTIQMWNTYRYDSSQTEDFEAGKPWLLRFFDQIRFYPVSEAELLQHRRDFIHGRFKLRIEHETFSLSKYNEFLAAIAPEAAAFKANQQAAFEAERERWIADDLLMDENTSAEVPSDQTSIDLPPNSELVVSHIPANVWQILVKKGEEVKVGDRLMILESMKMEMNIVADVAGTVIDLLCTEGEMVSVGQGLCIIQATNLSK